MELLKHHLCNPQFPAFASTDFAALQKPDRQHQLIFNFAQLSSKRFLENNEYSHSVFENLFFISIFENTLGTQAKTGSPSILL